MSTKVKFVNVQRTDFLTTLKARVDQYMDESGRSRHADAGMVFKTFAMLTMMLAPYFIILAGDLPLLAMWLLTIVMGFGKAGIGMGVMHDAIHGSYSSKKWLNSLIGRSINLIGGHVITWKIQHNVLHHTYTNIEGHDEDIETIKLMRFSPHTEWRPAHRSQHLHSVFFYGLMTLFWALHKDVLQLIRYEKMGLVKRSGGNYRAQLLELVLTKALYYGYILAIPMVVTDLTLWQWAIGFMTLHFVAGVILGLVFQAAHVVEDTQFPLPDDKKRIENAWAVHQLNTTADYARGNKLVTWYCGGLNYQIEHHLFPTICHIHYPKLATIVEETAREYSLPYHQYKTFSSALASHFRFLKALGQPSPSPVV